MENIVENFIERLRATPNKPTIAKASGVSLRTIEEWLYKNRIPSLDKAQKVARAIGYDLQLLKL